MSHSSSPALSLLLVGCGKMGSALLRGWLAHGMLSRAVIVEPSAQDIPKDPHIHVINDATAIPSDFKPDVIVFAVKPQILGDVIGHYVCYASPKTLFLSIAAGKTIGFFEKHLGASAKIVRAMPNTPASIHAGITAACANSHITSEDRHKINHLLQAVGDVVWVDDEKLMNAVTALSGSGPAYVFLLIEAMTRAGAKTGLPAELAGKLARATVYGSGLLARKEPGTSAETLRQNVTSPGGTTAAALGVLMRDKDGMQKLFDEAIAAATHRGQELES